MPLVADRAGVGRIDKHIASKNETGAPQFTFAITPSDTVDLPENVRAIYVGGAGNITVQDLRGNTRLYQAVSIGTWQPISAKRVMSTGTTATALLGGR
jgi:hypothetical protein